MKEKTLKIFILLMSLALVMSSLTISATGCGRDAKIYEDGFFQYIVLGQSGPYSDNEVKDTVAIVGLTALGSQQEVIDFPEKIDGKPVRYIGYRNWSTFAESFFYLKSDNLKKVYIHENIKRVCRDAFAGIADGENLEIMFCSPKDPYAVFDDLHDFNRLYLYKSVYDPSIFNNKFHCANVVFKDNFSLVINSGYYRLDNIKAGEKIPEPLPPSA